MAPGPLAPVAGPRATRPRPAPGPLPPDLAAARPVERRVGLYLHVPFCARRCQYCSFATAPAGAGGEVDAYVASLRRELELLGGAPFNTPRLTLATLFLGGGTPSLLEPVQLERVLAAVRAAFEVEPDAEVTLECNPESAGRDRLAAYRALGVNRISLGVQALDDDVLRVLGRLHDARGARRAFEAARAAGLANVSVDLMYGLPGASVEGWRRGVDAVLAWGPDHLSAYALTLDEGSAWGGRGAPGLPSEESVVAQYWALAEAAAARGLEHYEISNYARPGRRSQHNLRYWRRQEYVAAGVSACGFLGDVRWGNARALPRYTAEVAAGRVPVETLERLTARQALAETLILNLRTIDGVPTAALTARADDDEPLRRRLADWHTHGWLTSDRTHTRLTESGFLVSDTLFAELL